MKRTRQLPSFVKWYPLLLVALPLFTLSLIYLSYANIQDTRQLAIDAATDVANEVSVMVDQRSLQVTKEQLAEVAESTALKVKSQLEKAISVASTLARVFAGMQEAGIAVDVGRDSVNSILRKVLESNNDFYAAYTLWEPDAFDMLDLAFSHSPGHDLTGRFIPYLYRQGRQQIQLTPASQYQQPDPGRADIWQGEYYQAVKEKLTPLLIAPWPRTVDGRSVTVISVVVPVVVNERFLGISGIDLKVDFLQELVDETAENQLPIDAKLLVMTDQGLIASLSRGDHATGQMAELVIPKQLSWIAALEQGGEIVEMTDKYLTILRILGFEGRVHDWAVYLRLPRSSVDAGAEIVRQRMMVDVGETELRLAQESASGLWQQLFVMTGVLLLIAVMLRLVKTLVTKERALRQSEGRMQGLMDNATAVIYMKDLQGRYLLVNKRWLQLFHVTEEQVVGYTDHELFSEEIADKFRANDILAFKRQASVEIEEQAPLDDGLHTYISLKFPLFDADRNCYATCGISTDITDRKEAEQSIQRMNAELERRVGERTEELSQSLVSLKGAQALLVQSEKMAALGDLVGGIAHEVNTPLGTALTAASSLQEHSAEFKALYQNQYMKRSDLEDFIEHNQESTDILLTNLYRAVELVENFKEVSVDQSSEDLRAFDARVYLDKVLQSLQPKIKHTRHRIAVNSDDGIEVTLFPGAFAQIITNLVINSLMHGFDGIEEGVIEIDLRVRNHHLSIEYRDNGVGVPESILERIFEPFVTSKRGAGGSGLGMSVVYNLVTRSMKGSIVCHSEPGQGVAISILLPQYLEL
ncbi:MAG: ATP-binding protein [Motiliproteus sp.]